MPYYHVRMQNSSRKQQRPKPMNSRACAPSACGNDHSPKLSATRRGRAHGRCPSTPRRQQQHDQQQRRTQQHLQNTSAEDSHGLASSAAGVTARHSCWHPSATRRTTSGRSFGRAPEPEHRTPSERTPPPHQPSAPRVRHPTQHGAVPMSSLARYSEECIVCAAAPSLAFRQRQEWAVLVQREATPHRQAHRASEPPRKRMPSSKRSPVAQQHPMRTGQPVSWKMSSHHLLQPGEDLQVARPPRIPSGWKSSGQAASAPLGSPSREPPAAEGQQSPASDHRTSGEVPP
mmetsp:Transcript_89027/g.254906  ORF Transcript_89027/g.254906 Transcript_89027/m.254906 type:complete len:288 (-) Transcript_89027:1181-2044(-)